LPVRRARRGNDIRATTYGSIKSILQNGLDRAFARPNMPDASPIRHANIRGRGYYPLSNSRMIACPREARKRRRAKKDAGEKKTEE
jgi:hypothetical protein